VKLKKNQNIFVHVIIIIFIGCVVYANSLDGQFIWDDNSIIKDNPYVKDWSYLVETLTSSTKEGSGKSGGFYRPFQMFTYMVDYSISGLNVRGYHITNVATHILVAIAVYGLVLQLFYRTSLAFLTSLFFIVHPVHTEAVAYISGRADMLGALFLLLSLIFYMHSLRRDGSVMILCSGLSYILALLSKENSMILLILLVMIHFIFKKTVKLKSFLTIFIISFLYVLCRVTLLKHLIPDNIPPTGFLERLPGVFVALTEYMRLMVVPIPLHMEYGHKLFMFRNGIIHHISEHLKRPIKSS